MTLTSARATRATAALALASFALAGCGSPSTEPTFTGFSSTPTSTVITHTSRVPKVVSPSPVPVRRPLEYNARMAVRYSAWTEARRYCDQRYPHHPQQHNACATLADEKFRDVAYNVRAREEASKVGRFETVYSTPPAQTSYSTVTSVETRRPVGSGTGLVPEIDESGEFASTLRLVVGALVGVLVLGAVALVLVRRRAGGYRPAHLGAAPSTYDTSFADFDLTSPTTGDLFDADADRT